MSKEYDTKDPRSVMSPSEDAKDTIITFALFHFEALKESGHSVDEAKALTAKMLESVYQEYCQLGKLESKLSLPVHKRLEKATTLAKELSKESPKAIAIYAELAQVQAQLQSKR